MTTSLPRIVLVVLVTLFASLAHADDPAERAAKRFFDRGEKLFALGKFDEALEQYQKAYDAKPFAAFLFNIGQCYRNLGDYEAAIVSYRKYLRADPEAPNRAQVEEAIRDLEEEVDKGNSRKFQFDRKPGGPASPKAPIYKTWWFWTGIAVVGAAGGIGIYAATRGSDPPETDLGNIVFTR